MWEWYCEGHDYQNWMTRSGEETRRLGTEYLECKSEAQQTEFVSMHDVRFSVLCELDYFDPVTMLVVGTTRFLA